MAIVEVIMKRFALLPVLFPGVLGVSRSWMIVNSGSWGQESSLEADKSSVRDGLLNGSWPLYPLLAASLQLQPFRFAIREKRLYFFDIEVKEVSACSAVTSPYLRAL